MPRERPGWFLGSLGRLVEWFAASRLMVQILGVLTAILVGIYAVFGIPLKAQIVVSIAFCAIGLLVTRLVPEYRMISVVLSTAVTTRYIIWRGTDTLNLNSGVADGMVSLLLFGAECYTAYVLLAGYFQTSVFLDRRPIPLPEDESLLPTVDVFIPTYNESVDVVRRTVVGAVSMDYPKKRVFLLDDGRREEMRGLAEEVGCEYMTRPDNKGAKAGNLNAAMLRTGGDLIAFFDADHVPTRSFLHLTVGFFLANDNLALVQTPHHFYNPDPFERNLYTAGVTPPEQNMFYHLVQVSNDFWNSTFFCGSCAVIRRISLEEVGGVAHETVTEDAHTALKMQNRGWDSAYLNFPQAAGLATERFSSYVSQRIRWARGMAQILRVDPPFCNTGLRWYQRVNYTIAASHFFFGLPRLVFLLAPVTYLVFGLNPLSEDVRLVLVFALPHLILSAFSSSAVNGNQRHTFWPEVYECAIAPYTAFVTMMALIAPTRGSFNVTPKGSLISRTTFDWRVVVPSIIIAAYCLFGCFFLPIRLAITPEETETLLVAAAWNVFNVFILSAAIAVALERPQRRALIRIPRDYPLVVEPWQPELREEDDLVFEEDEDGEVVTHAGGELSRSWLTEPSDNAPSDDDAEGLIYVQPDDADSFDAPARIDALAEADVLPEENIPSVEVEELAVEEIDEVPLAAGHPAAWSQTGRMLDLSEDGVRFTLRDRIDVDGPLSLTVFGEDGQTTRVYAEPLSTDPHADGFVVRARFTDLTIAQRHDIIRLMFSSPNAWSRDRYAHDRPLASALRVVTSPFKSVFYAMGLARTPDERLPPEAGAVNVHEAVLQCYHCGGVLFRPLPRCIHCGQPLLSIDESYGQVYDGTFDAPIPAPWVRRWRERGVTPYLLPAMLILFAILVAVGGEEMVGLKKPPQTEAEAIAYKVEGATHRALDLAVELRTAIETNNKVPGDWGARLAALRGQFPGDGRELQPGSYRDAHLPGAIRTISDVAHRHREGERPGGLLAELTPVEKSLRARL